MGNSSSRRRLAATLAMGGLLALVTVGAASANQAHAGIAAKASSSASSAHVTAARSLCRRAKTHLRRSKRRQRCVARRLRPMSSSQATQVTNVDLVIDNDFGDMEFDPCTLEAFFITGHEHMLIHDSTSSSTPPGFHEMQISVDTHGQGTGVSGATYVIDDHEALNVQIPGPPNTTSSTADFYYKAVRQGELFDPVLHTALEDDFFWHTLLHMTFNAAGVPTAFVTKGDPLGACR